MGGILPCIERYYTDFAMFFKFFTKSTLSTKRIYLDYASSTPLDLSVIKKTPYIPMSVIGANPHALHAEGVLARSVLDDARALVAATVHAHSDEIVFTSGATESDNLALKGLIEASLKKGIAPHEIAIVVSDIEHAAILETVNVYIDTGMLDITLPTHDGVVDPKHVVVPEGCKVVLVSILYVNNEIGTVQPIKDIAKRVRYMRKHHPDVEIYFHTDATQAPAHFSLNIARLGVDMMTLGATKLYAHKGVGVLYKKRNITLSPIMHGGGQEFGLRPGTEPIALAHSFAHALKYAIDIQEQETERVKELQTYFEQQLAEKIPEVLITAHDQDRTPHITHVGIKNFDSELLVIELDARGIAVSAKSACKNEEDSESSIVEKLYGKGWGAVRFSFGRMTKKGDLDRAIQALKRVVEKYRK